MARSSITLPEGKRTPLCAVRGCTTPVVARLGPFAVHADPPPIRLGLDTLTWDGSARLTVTPGFLRIRVPRFNGNGQATPARLSAHHAWMPFRASIERETTP